MLLVLDANGNGIKPILSLAICHEKPAAGPVFIFDNSFHDFESVTQGEVVDHFFEFQNGGNNVLIIENIITSCGCTASEWTKEPIRPGQRGCIKVTFDSTGKIGHQRKIITILSNAESEKTELIVEAFVLPRKSAF